MDGDSLIAIVAFCSAGLSWVLVCCAACCCSGLEAAACCCSGLEAAAGPKEERHVAAVAAAGPSRRDARPEQQHERTAAPAPEPAVAGKPQLGHFRYSVAAEEGGVMGASEKVCAICLDQLVDGMECSKVPACGHVYCRECITLRMRSRSTCPLCRELIMPGSVPLSAAEAMV